MDPLIGTIVEYKGENAIVMNVERALGFRQFHLLMAKDGSRVIAHKHEIEIPPQPEMFLPDEDLEMTKNEEPQDQPSTEIKNERNDQQRFVVPNENDLEELAVARLSKATQHQTTWAVRVFRGK
jgi:hypothetical protein